MLLEVFNQLYFLFQHLNFNILQVNYLNWIILTIIKHP